MVTKEQIKQAIKECIVHWEVNRDAKEWSEITWGTNSCALCQLFNSLMPCRIGKYKCPLYDYPKTESCCVEYEVLSELNELRQDWRNACQKLIGRLKMELKKIEGSK